MAPMDDAKNGKRRFLLKRMLPIPLGLVALAATLLAPAHPDWADAYSRAVYPALSSAAAFLPSLVPFSVAEWFVAAFLLFCLGYSAYYVRKIVVSPGERGMAAYRGVMGAIAVCCVLYASSTRSSAGSTTTRHTFAETAGYDLEAAADADPAARQAELERLTASLVEGLGQARAQLGEDADLFAAEPGEFERYAGESVAGHEAAGRALPGARAALVLAAETGARLRPHVLRQHRRGRPSPSPWNRTSTWTTRSSWCRGRWRTSWRTNAASCARTRRTSSRIWPARSPTTRSCATAAFCWPTTTPWARCAVPTRSVRPRSRPACAEPVRRDLAERAEHWAQYEGPVQDVSNAANDAYLKANNQSDGMQSYGRMVDLLLAEQRAEENGSGELVSYRAYLAGSIQEQRSPNDARWRRNGKMSSWLMSFVTLPLSCAVEIGASGNASSTVSTSPSRRAVARRCAGRAPAGRRWRGRGRCPRRRARRLPGRSARTGARRPRRPGRPRGSRTRPCVPSCTMRGGSHP